MSFDREKYQTYVSILKEELIPAVGCTEPACLALAEQNLETCWRPFLTALWSG